MHVGRLSRSEMNRFAEESTAVASNARKLNLSPQVEFSKHFGLCLHSRVTRDNGKPYSDHLEYVATKVEGLIAIEFYRVPAVGASWLHDAHEDIRKIQIKNPFTYPAFQYRLPGLLPKSKKMVINDCLVAYGIQGQMEAYIIYVLTRDKRMQVTKLDYMANMFNAMRQAPDDITRNTMLSALVIKSVDRDSNTDPTEKYCSKSDLEAAQSIVGKDTETAIKFLERTNVLRFFLGDDGTFTGFSEQRFTEALEAKFEGKKQYTALDNLSFYLPMLERWLLVEPGLEGRNKKKFNSDKVGEVTVYDYKGVEALLVSTYEKSIQMVSGMNWPDQGPYEFARTSGASDIVKVFEGYTPLIERIRQDRLKAGTVTKSNP